MYIESQIILILILILILLLLLLLLLLLSTVLQVHDQQTSASHLYYVYILNVI